MHVRVYVHVNLRSYTCAYACMYTIYISVCFARIPCSESEILDAAAATLSSGGGFTALWNRRGLPSVFISNVYDRCCQVLEGRSSAALASLLATIDLDRLPLESWMDAPDSARLSARLASSLDPAAPMPIKLRDSALIIPRLLRRRSWSSDSGAVAAQWLLNTTGMSLEHLHGYIGSEVGKGISAAQPTVLFTSGVDDDVLLPFVQLALRTSAADEVEWLGPAVVSLVTCMWMDPGTPADDLEVMRGLLLPFLPSPSAFLPVLMQRLVWDMDTRQFVPGAAKDAIFPEDISLLQKRLPFIPPNLAVPFLADLADWPSPPPSDALPLMIVSHLASLLVKDETCVSAECGLLLWIRLRDWLATRLLREAEAKDPIVICFAHLFRYSTPNEPLSSVSCSILWQCPSLLLQMQAVSILIVVDHLMTTANHALLKEMCGALGQKAPLPDMLSSALAAVSRSSSFPDETALASFATARPMMSSQLSTSNTLRHPVRVKHFLWSSVVVFVVEMFASLAGLTNRSSCAHLNTLPNLLLVANPKSGASSFTDIFSAADLLLVKQVPAWSQSLSLLDDTQANLVMAAMSHFTAGLMEGLMTEGANAVCLSLAHLMASWIAQVLPSLETQSGTMSLVKVMEGLEAQMVVIQNELGLSVTPVRKPKPIYSDGTRILHLPWGAYTPFHYLSLSSGAPFQRVILTHLHLTFAILRAVLYQHPSSQESKTVHQSSNESFIAHFSLFLATPARFAYSKRVLQWTLAELSCLLKRWQIGSSERLNTYDSERFCSVAHPSPAPARLPEIVEVQVISLCLQVRRNG